MTPSPRGTVLGALDPASALAWDEAIARSPLDRPTLLLWRTQPAVVIGRFQRADWEIDAGACARRGVRVWRRFTGGGAVMIDPGTLCFALAWPAGHPWAAAGVPEMYLPLLDGIVRACRAQGIDVKYFGGQIHYIANAYLGRKGLKPELTAANLEGKTVAASSPNSPTDIYGREVLIRHGIDPAKLKFIYTQSAAAAYAGLSTGQFDLASIAPPYAFTLADDPSVVTLSPLLAERVPYAVSWPAAHTDWLRSHEAEARGIMLSLRDGIAWAKANPDEAQVILGKYIKEDNKDSLKKSYDMDLTRYGPPESQSTNDPEALTMLLKYAVQADSRAASVKAEDLIYENDKIYKSLGS